MRITERIGITGSILSDPLLSRIIWVHFILMIIFQDRQSINVNETSNELQ